MKRKKNNVVDTCQKKLVLREKIPTSIKHITISICKRGGKKHNYITLSGPYM
jgi:hypothetical protein